MRARRAVGGLVVTMLVLLVSPLGPIGSSRGLAATRVSSHPSPPSALTRQYPLGSRRLCCDGAGSRPARHGMSGGAARGSAGGGPARAGRGGQAPWGIAAAAAAATVLLAGTGYALVRRRDRTATGAPAVSGSPEQALPAPPSTLPAVPSRSSTPIGPGDDVGITREAERLVVTIQRRDGQRDPTAARARPGPIAGWRSGEVRAVLDEPGARSWVRRRPAGPGSGSRPAG